MSRPRSRPQPANSSGSSSSDDEPKINSKKSSLPRTSILQQKKQLPSLTRRAFIQTLTTTANLANLLPTGTLLSFQLLTPIFTTNGVCNSATRPLVFILLVVLSLTCLLACFTDSFKSPEGQVYYGFATFNGMYLFDYPYNHTNNLDLSKYKIRFIDVVHGILSIMVFVAVAIRDRNVVSCFYPQPVHHIQEVVNILPIGVGLVCSFMFAVFPSRRHGIGFPVTTRKL